MKKLKLGATAQKVMLLLFGGLALGLSGSPAKYFRILKTIKKDWQRINRYNLHRAIRKLYQSRLIEAKDRPDGSTTIILTAEGRARALTYKINEMRIPEMKNWDGKWRIVLFDIPERFKKARDALSKVLKRTGFCQFQKSVFVHPFECQNEVDFVVEFFNLRPHVRFIVAEKIDNELHLKKHFGLL